MTQSATAGPALESGHVRGMTIMSIGMLILPVMDAIGKYLATEEGISPGQVTFYRFAMQLVFTVAIVVFSGGLAALKPRLFWWNILRGVLIGLASVCFFAAVKYMPIADALAIFFVEPFILTAFSAIFLGERVGWRRWSAIGFGFIGALIVIEPSFSRFGWIACLPLGTATLFATYLILNRRLGAEDSPMVMQYVAGLGGTVVSAFVLLFGMTAGIGDLMPSLPTNALSLWLIATLGLLATFGHVFVVKAFQLAPASLLAPFQYLEIVSAVILGFVVFGDIPSLSKWVGIAIIVSSGLFVFHREQKAAAG